MESIHSHWLVTLAALVSLAGCATGDKVYTSTDPKNLHIVTNLDGGSFGTTYGVLLYVYELDKSCKPTYLGYTRIEQPTMQLGLPIGKPLMLTAEFVRSGRFGGGAIRNSYEYLIQPQPSHEYFADLRYQNNFYKFSLTESRNGGPKRAVERKAKEQGCAPQGA